MSEKNLDTDIVVISREEYDILCSYKLYFTLIEDALYKTASLSWDKERLKFDTSILNDLLELITKTRYKKVLMKLQMDEEMKKERHDGADNNTE